MATVPPQNASTIQVNSKFYSPEEVSRAAAVSAFVLISTLIGILFSCWQCSRVAKIKVDGPADMGAGDEDEESHQR